METDNKDVQAALDELSSRELGDVKVLIVEDDTMISELLAAKLSKSGCIPYSTADGNEAIDLVKQYMPHVVILDLMLPGMSGEDILRAIKGSVEIQHIPVIIFTNKSEEGGKAKLLDEGAAKYYIKAETDLNEIIDDLKELTR